MKARILFIIIFVSILTKAQINENFSDGNFDRNPEWRGNTENFRINEKLQLQSCALTTSVSSLITNSESIVNAQWKAQFIIKYSTSSSNYAAMYIISDNENIKNANKIGGFHYGLISENFEAQNNIDKKHASKIAGINAYSIWDEKHRPICDPKGMVYIKKANIWVDIYLCNANYKENGISSSFGAILAGDADEGRELPNKCKEFKYQDFVKLGNEFKKRIIKRC